MGVLMAPARARVARGRSGWGGNESWKDVSHWFCLRETPNLRNKLGSAAPESKAFLRVPAAKGASPDHAQAVGWHAGEKGAGSRACEARAIASKLQSS